MTYNICIFIIFIYCIQCQNKVKVKRAENDSGHERVRGSGRLAKKMTKKNIERLMFDHHDCISTRQAARKFKCTQPYIVKTFAKKTEIKIHKKKRSQSEMRTSKSEFVFVAIGKCKANLPYLTTSGTSLCHTQRSMETTTTTRVTLIRLQRV